MQTKCHYELKVSKSAFDTLFFLQEVANGQNDILMQLEELLKHLEQELKQWRAKQKQKSIGMLVDECLDQTQQWYVRCPQNSVVHIVL